MTYVCKAISASYLRNYWNTERAHALASSVINGGIRPGRCWFKITRGDLAAVPRRFVTARARPLLVSLT